MNDMTEPDLLAVAAPAAPAEPPPFEPGVYDDMPAEQYHAIEAMSASGAKEMLRSPLHYRWMRDHPKEPTDSMRLGTVAHTAILEPHRLDALVLLRPDGLDKRTKAGRAEVEALEAQAAAEGRLLVTQEQYDRACRMRDAVRRHPGAQRLLEAGRAEVSLFWRDAQFDVPCKMRADWLRDDGGIVDVKTTTNAAEEDFGRAVANYLYHVQAAHYLSGAEHLLHRTPPFFAFVALENEPPYGVATYVMQPNQILAGARLMERALVRYQQALARNWWPGYYDTIEALQMPGWALREAA